ncbi:hypothetical protein VNO78_11268 [Psophocarpus tetragonolobus]|uniref:Uncharacterized protein n=1 Tax=Psophocarpus tetragonolobus TaxID=3891 RepID=A0AAN9STA9_PSOTE
MSVTAGVSDTVIAIRDKLRGKIGQTKVKRYWPGKVPEWADDENEDVENNVVYMFTLHFCTHLTQLISADSLKNSDQNYTKMPKVKTNRVKYPEGWELIEPTLRELQAKMREAENDPHDGKRKCETLWPIFKIAHQKSRYIFDLYHRRKEISKELYEFCLDQGYADRNLIAKWKKPGYERLCCLRCMQPRDHNFATTCVCRVPKQLREEKVIECVHCGCKGCASGD